MGWLPFSLWKVPWLPVSLFPPGQDLEPPHPAAAPPGPGEPSQEAAPGLAWQVSFWEKPQRKGAPLGGREELGKVSSLSGLKFPGGGRPLSTSGALRSHRVSLSPQPPSSATVPECPRPALLQGLPREGWVTNRGLFPSWN